ncbi:hypothetical protein NDU88_006416 [Pleurodeles waltl]|uniref:CCHC-type domain-containing protein n=1 Tax=Pleurodeles waltl TaxID=8319 RepID=A0AAV7PJN6_PLEWA|nr:hypothetical protein NDU88_006416 [Pleurodeles waltl]
MGTPLDAAGTSFRIKAQKEKTDFTESALCLEPEKTEERRPLDAEEESPAPAQTPENNEAASAGARETTIPGARHNPGGSWLYKDAITIAKIVEDLEICMREIDKKGGGSPESEEEVAVVMKKSNSSKHCGATSSKQGIRSSLLSKSKFCARCGSSAHTSNAKWCFAVNKECRKCGRKGHFAWMCKDVFNSRVAVVDLAEESSVSDRILVVQSPVSERGRENRPKGIFTIADKKMELMVVLGSLYTIIPKSLWIELWHEVPLLPKDINPRGYQEVEIDVLGYFISRIEFGHRCVEGKIYVAESGPPILGWEHQFDLHIIIDPHSESKVLMVEDGCLEKILEDAKAVFDEKLGELKNYVHKIVLKKMQSL